VEIEVSARRVHPRNSEPQAPSVDPIGELALDLGREPAPGLDATWLDIAPRRVRLRWPADGLTAHATVGAGSDAVHVAVATPEEPDAAAVEPVTHAPWALDRLAGGDPSAMRLVDPGDAVTLVIELEITRDR
jgi:hypothetical protein